MKAGHLVARVAVHLMSQLEETQLPDGGEDALEVLRQEGGVEGEEVTVQVLNQRYDGVVSREGVRRPGQVEHGLLQWGAHLRQATGTSY